MKITLLETYSKRNQYINKDVMGGYGMIASVGPSFLAKTIERKKKASVNLPVFALGYLAAILKKNGHQVDYQFNAIPQDADLIIIPSSIVDYKFEIEFIKKIKAKSKARVGVFGPFASYIPDLYLTAADFVIKGEPENVVNKLSANYLPTGVVASIPVSNLNDLPFPDWEIFPIENYSYRPNLMKKPFLPVLSSRGCTFNCHYCPYGAYYGHLRTRSPESVIAELKYLKDKFNIRSVQFRDPLFTANEERVLAIINGMLANRLDLEWGCETHVNCLNYQLIDRMYQAGLRALNLGIEAADAELLKKSSRLSAAKQKEIEIIEYCHKKGIKIAAFYILGMPADNDETIINTLKYAKKLNTLVAQFFIFTPFPGTPFYEKLKDKIVENDWERFNSFNLVFQHDNLSYDSLMKLKEKAFVSYYFRPAYFYKHFKHLLKNIF